MGSAGSRRLFVAVAVGGAVVLVSLLSLGALTAVGDVDDDGLTVAEELDAGTEITTADTDGDGLDDGEEVSGSTDPTAADTDGDGLEDGEERNRYGTDPTASDTDGDGLSDHAEVQGRTDPTRADTDGDGLDDGEEQERHGTDPTAADTDDDGLEDGPELERGTDPTEADTDADGLEDGAEIEAGADPTDPDTDGDGLEDGEERNRYGTDPTERDTDGDGLEDREEVQEYDTDPTASDTDDDALDDGREVELGTDPTDEDTDGDRLLDGWEVRGHGGGAEYPRADPLQMDLYLQVNHGSQFEDISGATVYEIRDHFAGMPIENPDGSRGITAHVVDDGDAGQPLAYDGTNFDELHEVGDDLRGSSAPHHRSVLIVDMAAGDRSIGLAQSPGDFSIVDGNPTYAPRSQIVVHEVLHNLVGRIDADGACADDPHHYCDGGFLEPQASPGNDYLPRPIGEQIEHEGFEPAS